MKIKVFIYDDNRSRRESLGLLISSHSDMELLASMPDCSEVVNNMQQYKPDVVLMDIQMPGVDGIQGVKLIHDNFPGIRVIMQTVFEDDDKIFHSILNGASGYILKKTAPDKVIEAIRDVYEGGSPITPAIASKVLRFFSASQNNIGQRIEAAVDYQLSEREKEILALLVEGLPYKLIADRCKISIYTVNAHIRRIYEKLQVHSATEAVAKVNRGTINNHSG